MNFTVSKMVKIRMRELEQEQDQYTYKEALTVKAFDLQSTSAIFPVNKRQFTFKGEGYFYGS